MTPTPDREARAKKMIIKLSLKEGWKRTLVGIIIAGIWGFYSGYQFGLLK